MKMRNKILWGMGLVVMMLTLIGILIVMFLGIGSHGESGLNFDLAGGWILPLLVIGCFGGIMFIAYKILSKMKNNAK